jgi:hypothetical protein
MQMCFIMGSRVPTQQGNIANIPKDKSEKSLPAQRGLHSSPVQRLIYHNIDRHLGTTEGFEVGKSEDKFQIDNSLELVRFSCHFISDY